MLSPSGPLAPTSAAESVIAGLRAGGIRTVISLPDSVLGDVARLADRDPQLRHIPCTREDEGLAIAAGLWLGGELATAVMEGSGVGYSGLILARMIKQRTPVLILASHNRVFGERHDFHAATILAGHGVVSGIGIASAVLTTRDRLAEYVAEAGVTARGQREPIALFVAPSVMKDS